jgi:ATP-dependent DNA helicase RecQ
VKKGIVSYLNRIWLASPISSKLNYFTLNTTLNSEPKFQLLKRYFGFDHFRPLQEEVIDTLLQRKNCLVLMPTGGGKSVCYQLPAMLLDGITLVVSPLIALMKDQVENLRANGIPAAFINSSITNSEQNAIWNQCRNGELKLLYLAPEKLFSVGVLDTVRALPVSLLAIDESHCISSWGHDFRPEYRQLSQVRSYFPDVPVVALTATADKVTRKDILSQLGIPDAEVFISSFDRPNLSLTVLPGLERRQQIARFLQTKRGQSGIIYCLSRKGTEDLSAFLVRAGYKANYYHAGIEAEKRAKVQESFIRDEIQIMCATIAFGMGIDKSNIRWVIHFNLPSNLESYYQEIGRAGRDGLPSETILYYAYGDIMTRLDMIEKSEADEEQKELRRAKLNRLKQYSEAQICRRRILLSYFNEEAKEDCGNCDVCLHPRKRVDATILAQKALSAIARTREAVSMTSLVDILRGQRTAVTVKNGFTEIPTFGAGRDLRAEIWMDYIMQMLNSGVMDIAYDEGHVFKLNPLSYRVLKEGEKVLLAEAQTFRERRDEMMAAAPVNPKVEATKQMFEMLRKLRKELADKENVAAYIIFSDATLNSMVEEKPISPAAMMEVQGMSQSKWSKYGKQFLKAIQEFLRDKQSEGTKLNSGITQLVSFELYQKGMGLEEIAANRKLSPGTIAGHLVQLAKNGEEIRFELLMSPDKIKIITEMAKKLGINADEQPRIQPLMEHFGDQFQSWELRLAMGSVWTKNGKG